MINSVQSYAKSDKAVLPSRTGHVLPAMLADLKLARGTTVAQLYRGKA